MMFTQLARSLSRRYRNHFCIVLYFIA